MANSLLPVLHSAATGTLSGTALGQLASSQQDFSTFTEKVQAAILAAKEATPQGLLLSQELKAGSITPIQFKEAIDSIILPEATLHSTAQVIAPAVKKLLVTLVQDHNTVVAPSLQTDFKDETLSFLQNLFKTAAAIAAQNLKASASSLLSLKPQPKVMSGARAVVKINGKVSALCNNVSYEVNTDWAEIRGIDEILPNDLAPMAFSVKGTFSVFRIPNGSPISQFIQQDMFRGIIWPYTTIEIRDKRTDELICLVKRAAITSRAETFSHGQLTSSQMSFVGIGFRDEFVPELLPDQLTGQDDSSGGLLDDFKQIGNAISNLF